MNISKQGKKENILFIVNPVSGKGKKTYIIKQINEHLNPDKYNVVFEDSKYKGHAHTIAEQYKEKGIKKIVAVGGDGTVNEIGSAIINTDISLGIIPRGSGNGLARFLSIPMNAKGAIEIINNPSIKDIDAAKVNDKYFFCTCGVGFDAHVGNIFNKYTKRRSINYFKDTIQEFLKYKPKEYNLKFDSQKKKVKSLLVTIANAGQYGNNVYISPDAKIDDGFLDLCILKPFPISIILPIGLRLIGRTLNKSKYLEVIKCKNIILKKKKKVKCHYDGETYKAGKSIKVEIIPASLKVMIP
ncbi:MAG: YegS/Rv2252/BmrU family lipid kinase [Bacteroidales bacterium]|nr:MAG: YegS/Rv2252/BmrU family lipid kinase [Bacteroidales bacterium]